METLFSSPGLPLSVAGGVVSELSGGVVSELSNVGLLMGRLLGDVMSSSSEGAGRFRDYKKKKHQ